MAGDLDGQDAFDKLLEVALESRVDVRRAQDERDNAREAQRNSERISQERLSRINDLERNEQRRLPLLQELWEAAEALRCHIIAADNSGELVQGDPMARLGKAQEGAALDCNQPPF